MSNPLVYFRSTFLPALVSVEVAGSPESLRRAAAQFLSDRPGLSVAAQASALREEFPCIETVTIRRSWLRRTVRLELALRSAVALARLKDRATGYLSDTGVLFEAPEGLYGVQRPIVEASDAGIEDLTAAAHLVRAAGEPGVTPAPLTGLRWIAAQDGGEARLEDGTVVLWGDGRWLAQKLVRLREAVSDARAHNEPVVPFVADMRYFEDGKVLLRPLSSLTFSMR